MAANVITLGRIFLTFFVILLFQSGFYFRVSAIILTLVVISLDSLDGIVARKLGLASEFGALFDITGDRIVEHIYLMDDDLKGIVPMLNFSPNPLPAGKSKSTGKKK